MSLNGALLSDSYELSMMQVYLERGMQGRAVFELFVRALPQDRSFLVAEGIEQAVDHLENLAFTAEELSWLKSTGGYSHEFLEELSDFRFRGDVDAMPEGTVFFPGEPVLRVSAPLPQAQMIEGRILNLVHFQTMIASKAVRCALAAPGKFLVDSGFRRTHGSEAALLAARASYLAGFDGSSVLEAGYRYGVPVFGTMAHSFVQAFGEEVAAFDAFARNFPENTAFVIDTLDAEEAAGKLVMAAPAFSRKGSRVHSVRIGGGDLSAHAFKVRAILDRGGLKDTRIFASGGLDEWELDRLVAVGAPIDGFGIGSKVSTSSDAPFLDCAYEIQEYEGRPTRRLSEGKSTWPGRKQVYRHEGPDGLYSGDTVALEEERPAGRALLRPVMRAGRRTEPTEPISESRARLKRELACLSPALRELTPSAAAYSVRISDAIQGLTHRLAAMGAA